MRRYPLALVFGLLGVTLVAQVPAWRDPARLLLIANTAMPDGNGNGVSDSLEVALRYAALRGVPSTNILPLSLSTSGTSFGSYAAFYNELKVPVMARVQALGVTQITTLVFCHGVPYAMAAGSASTRSVDQAMMTPSAFTSASAMPFPAYWAANSMFDAQPGIAPEWSHFQHQFLFNGQHMYLVARIDGPTPEEALDLVEGARYGEEYIHTAPGAYGGRIYVDTRFSNYSNPAALPWPFLHSPSYAEADSDMAYATQWMTGFPLWWENTANDLEIGQAGAQFSNGASATTALDALFYYGWYNFATYHDVWWWKAGSAACDLNSNSLDGVRSPQPSSFGAWALRRGASACVGVIAEPYLPGHPFPEIFIKSLLDGRTFAESAAVSDPTVLWRSLYVGDPLYCPMPVGKPVVYDTLPPPVPSVQVVLNGSASGTLSVSVDTLLRPADPIVLEGTWGRAPLLNQVFSGQRGYRAHQRENLTGLSPSSFYRFRPRVRDPVGQVTAASEQLHFNAAPGGDLVVVQSEFSSAPAGTALHLEGAIQLAAGLPSLQWLGLDLSAPHLGLTNFDLLPWLAQMNPVLHSGNGAHSLEWTVPAGLPAGTYTFRLAVQTAAGLSQGSTQVILN
jgi:uncharacterized protein (TIGR03790 family)